MKPRLLGGTLRRAAVAAAAALLAAAAAGLALAALYLFAAGVLGGMLAALVTAGGALILAGLLLLGGCGRRAWHRDSRRRHLDPGEIGEVLARLLRHNAKKATVGALITGLALGMSPELRRSLLRLLKDLGRY